MKIIFPFYSIDIYHASSSALAPLSVTVVLGLVLMFSGLVTALTLSIIVVVLILVLQRTALVFILGFTALILILVFSFNTFVTFFGFVVEHLEVYMVRLFPLQTFVVMVLLLVLRRSDWPWTWQFRCTASRTSFGFIAEDLDVYLLLIQMVVMILCNIIVDGYSVFKLFAAVDGVSRLHAFPSFFIPICTAVRSCTTLRDILLQM